MDIKERLEQNKIDTERLLEEKGRLERELKEQEKVVFKAGDIVDYIGSKRIIVNVDGKFWAIDCNGIKCGNDFTKDATFASCNYKKIGRLSDYIND